MSCCFFTNREIFKKLNKYLHNSNPICFCFHGSMFIDDKDIRELIHQYNLKHTLHRPTSATQLNNILSPKRATLVPPKIKLFNIPQDVLQED